jgi:hypothetical protein
MTMEDHLEFRENREEPEQKRDRLNQEAKTLTRHTARSVWALRHTACRLAVPGFGLD